VYNFKVNFQKKIRDNTPDLLRRPRRINFVKAAIKPLRNIYKKVTKAGEDLYYATVFNGEVLYLETALNDRFDPIDRGIYITDMPDNLYIFFYDELREEEIEYLSWNVATNYPIGTFVERNGDIYKNPSATSLGDDPLGGTPWVIQPDLAPPIDYSIGELNPGFIVNIPSIVVFDEPELRRLVEYYKFSGIEYILNIV